MFIISLTYKVSIEKVDETREAHLKFLDNYFAKSIFLASGPKVPRNGGIILADKVTKGELDNIIKEDPFWINQVADYEITEFNPTKCALTVN